MDQETKEQFEKINERFDNLEERVDRYGSLLMILVSDAVRDQFRKDDLYPFETDEQKIETAVSRIIERQNWSESDDTRST